MKEEAEQLRRPCRLHVSLEERFFGGAPTMEEQLFGGMPKFCREFVHAGVAVVEGIVVDVLLSCGDCDGYGHDVGGDRRCVGCGGSGRVVRWRVFWTRKPWQEAWVGGVANPIIKCDCDGETGVEEAREKIRAEFNRFYGIVEKGHGVK